MLNLYGVGATNGKSEPYQSILSIAVALLVLIFAVASAGPRPRSVRAALAGRLAIPPVRW
jgi:hypothetical protein